MAPIARLATEVLSSSIDNEAHVTTSLAGKNLYLLGSSTTSFDLGMMAEARAIRASDAAELSHLLEEDLVVSIVLFVDPGLGNS